MLAHRSARRPPLPRPPSALPGALLSALLGALLGAPPSRALPAHATPPTAAQVARAEDPACDHAAIAALKPNERLAHVRGMVCGFCVQGVEKLVGALEGVQSAKVDLTAGAVLITVDPARAPTEEQIREAIHKAGYELKDLHAPPAPSTAGGAL